MTIIISSADDSSSAFEQLPARERILQTALRLFYQEGIRATGIDRLIAESGVTKATFYRHFPAKNDLICAFLEARHDAWIDWFASALQRQQEAGNQGLAALVPALAEWLGDRQYRGCAFINAVVELGSALPETVVIAQRHKAAMTQLIATLLSADEQWQAQAIAVAVDGAIVHAQLAPKPTEALAALSLLLAALR